MRESFLVQTGRVIKGGGKAEGLGYPTANIGLARQDIAGTYAGEVLFDGTTYQAAVYADPQRKLLEAHLFDFSGDLYGKEIQISLLKKVAEPVLFTSETDAQSFLRDVVGKVEIYFERK